MPPPIEMLRACICVYTSVTLTMFGSSIDFGNHLKPMSEWLSSRDLARVLPPAGQNFEKYTLENFDDFPSLLVIFKLEFSKGAAPGGPEF